MNRTRTSAQSNRFAWQYSFYAYLVYRQAPASARHLADLAQALHALRGHRDPFATAAEVLRAWPFEVTH